MAAAQHSTKFLRRLRFALPIQLVSVIAVVSLITGCMGGGHHGYGGGGGGGGTPVAGGTASIVEPSSAQFPGDVGVVIAGGAIIFLATVTNDNGGGVTWFANAGSFGSANTPKKTPTTYTAPSSSSLGSASFLVVTISAYQPGVYGGTNGPTASFLVIVAKSANLLPTAQLSVFNTSLTTPSATSFVFRIRGFTAAGSTFSIIGRFTMDGVGSADESTGITAGLEDVNIAVSDHSAPFKKVAFTGGYNMDSPSHGTMKLNVTSPPWVVGPDSPPTSMTISFTLSEDATFGDMIEADAGGAYAGSGDFTIQDPNTADFTTSKITGSYVLSIAGPSVGAGTAPLVHRGIVARLDLSAGNVLNTSTFDDGVNLSPQTTSGTYTVDDATNGHGAFTTTMSATEVSFYIVGPGALYALETDAIAVSTNGAFKLGVVHRIPPGSSFDNTSLTGPSVFLMQGMTATGHASAAVGVFSGTPGAAGVGTLAGEFDANDGGTIPPGAPLQLSATNATFTIGSDGRGRGTFSIISGGVTYNFVFYLRSASVSFFLEQPASDGTNRGRSGLWIPQIPVPGGSFKGGVTFMAGTTVSTAASLNNVAVLSVMGNDSSGNVSGTSYSSKASIAPQLPESVSPAGTYTVSATDPNQRATVTTPTGKIAGNSSLAFYADFAGELIGVGTDSTNQEPQLIFLDQ